MTRINQTLWLLKYIIAGASLDHQAADFDETWGQIVPTNKAPILCVPTDIDGIVSGDSGGIPLKIILRVLLCGVMAASTFGQDQPVKIMLVATSTTPAAYLIENLTKDGCSNVTIVTDQSQADYTLEAQGGDFEGPHGSAGPHGPQPPRPKAKYTLSKNGAVVFGTTPIKEKSAVKDLCKYLQHGPSK